MNIEMSPQDDSKQNRPRRTIIKTHLHGASMPPSPHDQTLALFFER